MKHTPGPWSVKIGTDYTRVVMKKTEVSLIMADLSGEADPRELAANARLIAAAPELLDIVQKFVSAFNTNYSASTMNYEFGADARRLLARIEGGD